MSAYLQLFKQITKVDMSAGALRAQSALASCTGVLKYWRIRNFKS